MKKKKEILNLIRNAIIGVEIGAVILYWGIADNGYFRIVLGLVILLLTIRWGINSYKQIKSNHEYLDNLLGRVVFFYPSKKSIQNKIKEIIIPQINQNEILQVFYEGPKLTGDIDGRLMKSIMDCYIELDFNKPALFKLTESEIHIEYLSDTLFAGPEPVNFQEVKKVLDKMKNA
ncbi:hypothetical protein NF867_04025 [Solitalea sp. MAHUQ-68]|uniref:Uncharacterized protein n=1 Tax=Solitalea agri TaxID=2953739 RepID=A0A9X2JC11_9SPHI|nr:hypothetical protein [Solitalea agri]MCO4292029.1 hypothetical protein [Solitalea agri]